VAENPSRFGGFGCLFSGHLPLLPEHGRRLSFSGKPSSNLHFYLNDWLGTRRVMTDCTGVVEQQCASLSYGDYESCNPHRTALHRQRTRRRIRQRLLRRQILREHRGPVLEP
jgi:hypothetical protein